LRGSARLTVYLASPVDLVKIASEMARRGLWVAKVLPTETGFEVLAPEPGLLGVKSTEEEFEYKLYAAPEGTNLSLFGDAKNFFSKVAELVNYLVIGGCNERCIAHAELNASFDVEGACSFGTVEIEDLGSLELRGLVARGEGEGLSLVPLSSDNYLMIYSVVGEWNTVKGRALSLHALAPKMWEVLKSWTCRR